MNMMCLTELAGALAALVAGVMTCVEVLPVRLNPWGWLFRQLGQAINGDIREELAGLRRQVESLSGELRRQQAESCQARIIRFGDELLHDALHSKEHFDQILLDISVYEQYCDANPQMANGVAALTIARIKQVYGDCLREHNFL